MERSPALYLDHVSLFRAFEPSPRSRPSRTPTSRSRTPKERRELIIEEQQLARRKREALEASRPKYFLDDVQIGHAKPAAFYIQQARERSLNVPRPRSAASKRSLNTSFGTSTKGTSTSPIKSTNSSFIQRSCRSNRPVVQETEASTSLSPTGLQLTYGLPEWITRRASFSEHHDKIKEGVGISLYEVCKLPVRVRNVLQVNLLVQWVSRIPFFQELNRPALIDLCGRFQSVALEDKEKVGEKYVVMKQGERGEFMYIVYRGVVDVLIGGSKVRELRDRAVFGEDTLQTRGVRTCTILVSGDCELLRLSQQDYDSVLLSVKQRYKSRVVQFLREIDFFESWQDVKLRRLSNALTSLCVPANHVLYEKGVPSDTFFLVQEGQIAIQRVIDVDEKNRWPIGKHTWEVSSLIKKVVCTLKLCGPHEMFGDKEMMENTERTTSAKAVGKAHVLAISKEEFFRIFTQREADLLVQYTNLTIPPDSELTLNISEATKSNKAVKKALLANFVFDVSSLLSRDCLMDPKMRKMKGWLQSVRKMNPREPSKMKSDVIEVSRRRVIISSISLLNGEENKKKKGNYEARSPAEESRL